MTRRLTMAELARSASIVSDFQLFEDGLTLDCYASFHSWSDRALDDGLLSRRPSTRFLNRLAAFLEPLPMPEAEAFAAIGITKGAAARIWHWATEHSTGPKRRKAAKITVKESDVSIEKIKKTLPLDFRHLRNTLLDPVNGEEYGSHDWKVIARLLGFDDASHNRLFAAMSFFVRQAVGAYLPHDLAMVDHEIIRDACRATGCGLLDATEVGQVIDALLYDETLVPGLSHSVRVRAVKTLYADRMRLVIHGKLHPQHEDAINSILPALPSSKARCHGKINGLQTEINKQFGANRKLTSDLLSNDFDDVLSQLRVRAYAAIRMDRHCKRIAETMRRRDPRTGLHRDGETLDFFYRERVCRPDGRRLTATQRVYMRARRGSSLHPDVSPDEIYFQYLHVEGDGPRSSEPWFVPMFRCGAFATPGDLPIDLLEARRRFILEQTVPRRDNRPGGLVFADGHLDGYILKQALIAGTILIPIRAFAHAMLIALVVVRVMAHTMCRIGEVLQMVHTPDGWTTVQVGGRAYAAFLSIPKGCDDEEEFPLNDKTMALLKLLSKMTQEREPDGCLRPAPPAKVLREYKTDGEKYYVLSFRGRHLDIDDVNFMFRILALGIGNWTTHDIRHASANRAQEEDFDLRTIKAMLRQKGHGTELAAGYSKRTEKQVGESRERYIEARELEDAMSCTEQQRELEFA